jgi:hypothetical protein
MCYKKVLSAQQSMTYITILYNRNNVNVLLLTSFILWTHAIITTGTGKYQLYTCTTAYWNPAWLVQSTKYINRIIKLSSLIRKLLDNASPVLKTTGTFDIYTFHNIAKTTANSFLSSIPHTNQRYCKSLNGIIHSTTELGRNNSWLQNPGKTWKCKDMQCTAC